MASSDTRYRETTKEDTRRYAGPLVGFIIVIFASAILLLPTFWYAWLALVISAVLFLAAWDTSLTGYRCPNCGHEFELSLGRNLVSPHVSLGKRAVKYVKCPECGRWAWAKVLVKVREEQA